MMEDMQKELIIRIVNECNVKGVQVTKDLAWFLLDLYLMNPMYRIKERDEESNERIIQVVTDMLCDQTKPSLITVKSQQYFVQHYRERDEIVKEDRLRLDEATRPLIDEICKITRLRNKRDTEELYRKILTVITLLSDLGDPTVPSVLKEVSTALLSVFQASELTHYVKLSRRAKEEQLTDLAYIVAGIRLFNRDCQRGGEGIDDLPSIVQDTLTSIGTSILEFLESLMSRIYKLTSYVENAIVHLRILGSPDDVSKEEANDVDETFLWALHMLTASRQHENYIRRLLDDLKGSENAIKSLMERLQDRFTKLHNTVRYRIAVPLAQVYPQFLDLADIWMGLHDEVIVLNNINNFLQELQILSKALSGETKIDDITMFLKIITDADRLRQTLGDIITKCGELVIYQPSITKDFHKIKLEFAGFCAWTFTTGRGALIPSNPHNGVAKWRGKYYAFRSSRVAVKFGENPDRYICKGVNFIRKHPEYMHLFQVYEEFKAMRSKDELLQQLKRRDNQKVQTDVHVLPPYIDKDYTSNIWELKRRALQLANISRCATHSTQTLKSQFRLDIHVQVSSSRDKAVQTRRDNSTNTKTLKTYIFGLRGRRDDCQHVVTFLEDEFGPP